MAVRVSKGSSRTRSRVALLAVAGVVAATAWHSAWAVGAAPPVLVTQVSVDPVVSAGEAWTATNPKNPKQVVVIWLGTTGDLAHPGALFTGYCGVGRSTDGGRTWKLSKLPLATTTNSGSIRELQPAARRFPICGDPMAGVGPDGTLYGAAVQLGAPTSFVQSVTSSDFGAHWTAPVQMFGAKQTASSFSSLGAAKRVAIGAGRGFMAVDPITGEISVQSQEDGAVEGRWLTVSSDRGKTWSTPRPLDPEVQSATAGAHSAAGGTIAVAYVVNPSSPNYVTSTKHAVTCAATCTVFETTTNHGNTWSRHVIKGIQGSSRSYVAADPAHLGRFAVLASTGSGIYDIWLTNDRGVSWKKTKTISAGAGEGLSKPWISYSPTGALGVVWRTQRSSGSTDVLAMVSRNGGTSFSRVVTMDTNIPAEQQVTPGDDCACNLHLDATTLSSTWTSWRTGQRQMYYGKFVYTNL